MLEPKTIRESLKEIADEIRMIIVLQLADLIIKIVPNNPDGDVWVLALCAVAQRQMQVRGLSK